MSHQLRLLRNLRLVQPRREGRMVFYALDDRHIMTLFRQGLRHVQENAAARRADEAGAMSAPAAAAAAARRARAAPCTPSRSFASTDCAAARRRRSSSAGCDRCRRRRRRRRHRRSAAARASTTRRVLSTNAIVDAVAETGMRAWLEHEEPIVAALARARAACSCACRRPRWRRVWCCSWLGGPPAWSVAAFVVAAVDRRRVSGAPRAGVAPQPRSSTSTC